MRMFAPSCRPKEIFSPPWRVARRTILGSSALKKSPSLRAQGLQDLPFRFRNFIDAGEEFQMDGGHVGQQCGVWPTQSGQGPCFSGMIHSQLEDRDLMLVGHFQEGEGNPDFVVPISVGLKDLEALSSAVWQRTLWWWSCPRFR